MGNEDRHPALSPATVTTMLPRAQRAAGRARPRRTPAPRRAAPRLRRCFLLPFLWRRPALPAQAAPNSCRAQRAASLPRCSSSGTTPPALERGPPPSPSTARPSTSALCLPIHSGARLLQAAHRARRRQPPHLPSLTLCPRPAAAAPAPATTPPRTAARPRRRWRAGRAARRAAPATAQGPHTSSATRPRSARVSVPA
jgi:hypothetical protein